jgi:excisionase family DNA binding protein
MNAPDSLERAMEALVAAQRAAVAAGELALASVRGLACHGPLTAGGASSPAGAALLLHVSEAGRLLGVDPETVRRMVRSGQLPSVRLGEHGHALRIPRAALEAWIEAQAAASARGGAGEPQALSRRAGASARAPLQLRRGGGR